MELLADWECLLPWPHPAVIVERTHSRGCIFPTAQDALNVVDVSVMHLAAEKNVNAAACVQDGTADARDQSKRVQYDNSDLLGDAFAPFSTENFCRLCKAAMALLNKLAGDASADGIFFKDAVVVNALRELCDGLCRENCVLCKQSL